MANFGKFQIALGNFSMYRVNLQALHSDLLKRINIIYEYICFTFTFI